jgi:predicted LPLAT superfamily acyltransferase
MNEKNSNVETSHGPESPAAAQNPTEDRRRIGSGIGMKMLARIMRLVPALAYEFALIPVVWYFIVKPEGRRAASVLYRRLGRKGGAFRRLWFGLSQARMFSKIILDNIYLGLFGSEKFVIEENGTKILLEQLSKGKGLVMLSAHMGNWHLAVNFLSNTKTPVHLVIDDVRTEEVRRQMDSAKLTSTHLTIHGAEAGAGLAFELSAALKRGEAVIIAGDRAGSGGRRVKARFLGKEAWFPSAALLLADTVGAPVCAALTFREGPRRYTCFGVGPLKVVKDAPKEERIRTMLEEFVSVLENAVRRYPAQWFNFYDFWKP